MRCPRPRHSRDGEQRRRALLPCRLLVPGASLTFALLLAGCGPHSLRQATCFDPTESCNWSVVVVRNDTPTTVILRPRADNCQPGDPRVDTVPVPAGASSPSTQYGSVYALTQQLNCWAVEDTSRDTLGCLLLDGHPDKRDGDVVLVSEAIPCRGATRATRAVGRTSVQSTAPEP